MYEIPHHNNERQFFLHYINENGMKIVKTGQASLSLKKNYVLESFL